LAIALNGGCPADDFATYGATVAKEIAGVVEANRTAKTYGEKVAHRFFLNLLAYEVGTPPPSFITSGKRRRVSVFGDADGDQQLRIAGLFQLAQRCWRRLVRPLQKMTPALNVT
jgi:hypothetical protein